MSESRHRIVVLISGSGTNLQALIDAVSADSIRADIVAVISNRPDVAGLDRAKNAGIPAIVLDHRLFTDRTAFDAALAEKIDALQADLVVLAGFMRILTPEFTHRYAGKMFNIHPSLLPAYQGLFTHQRALDAGEKVHGVTVHFVTAELDGGPAVIQVKVPVLADDNAESLAKRVQQQEHLVYPMAVKWFTESRLRLTDGQVWLDNEPLPSSGHLIDTTRP